MILKYYCIVMIGGWSRSSMGRTRLKTSSIRSLKRFMPAWMKMITFSGWGLTRPVRFMSGLILTGFLRRIYEIRRPSTGKPGPLRG